METSHLSLPSGLTLATTRTASQPPEAILIHGWTCRRSDWDDTLAALAPAHSLVSLDLPGHGDSVEATPSDWRIEALAESLAQATHALTDQPVVLVGHSMGGAVALEAARSLENVAGVVLVDTFVIPYGDLTEDQAQDTERPFYDDFATAIDGLVENFTAADIDRVTKKRLKQQMQSADPRHMLPLWSALLRWNPESALTELQVPMHAINGNLIPEAARNRCKGRVTEWHLEGAGHFPQAEMPERFHACLDTLLKQLA